MGTDLDVSHDTRPVYASLAAEAAAFTADEVLAPDLPGLRLILRRSAKRSMDVTLALLGLVFLAPVMAVIAVAIRIDSQGPVLFSQVRIGRNRRRGHRSPSPVRRDRRRHGARGSQFTMYKFRTMRVNAARYSKSPTNPMDHRITNVGRFLRRTSLDELPQLFNVLLGNMSLVGPRPEMPFLVARYTPLHARRLEMTPGLTGLWQLHGPRDRLIHEAIEWDLRYVERWSLRMDVRIILETFLFALRARNH